MFFPQDTDYTPSQIPHSHIFPIFWIAHTTSIELSYRTVWVRPIDPCPAFMVVTMIRRRKSRRLDIWWCLDVTRRWVGDGNILLMRRGYSGVLIALYIVSVLSIIFVIDVFLVVGLGVFTASRMLVHRIVVYDDIVAIVRDAAWVLD